ncbi:MAG: DNA repair protein RecN, partial [Chromatiales bacterium]|nr:DNA repair protein RecN [Chromatiales bacterium]
HGQHEHQSLMDSAVQRDVLDAFGEHDTLLAKVGNAFHALRALQTELSELSGGHDDQSAHRALLTYQISELTELSPQPGEFEASRLELGRLSRVEEHRANALAALTNLEDNEGGAETALQRALGLVRDMAELDDSLGSCVELLESAAIHMDEAKTVLREFSERQSADPARLAALDERLDALQNVARKHHVDADELAPLQSRLETELATLEGAEQRLSQLDEELTAARKRYDKAAQALTKSRRIAATAMSDAVTANMHELGMPNGRCVLDISPQDDDTPRHHGADRVSIQIATNPGAQPQPLTKVASGGELSRVSLAVQVVLAAADSSTGALVFDEVDVGVGGGVAEIVGKRLRSVASTRQVLCVTHLPQVACQGHQHIRVAKTVDEGTARTQLEPLGQKTKVDEIARMLGGVEVTKRTLAHAREMLNLAHN